MKPDILEVHPLELEFLFELKKQSSCSVQMINKTNHHVAFKIKTTNPKKYCVRPNAGVIHPNALCDFTGAGSYKINGDIFYAKKPFNPFTADAVTMQAPKVAPPDMICRDKFLVQSTIVPEGTKEEDVTSNMFAKEDGKIVDEKRLKVIFVSPPNSLESSTLNEPSKLVHNNESRILKDDIIQKDSPHAKVDDGMKVSKGDGESEEATRNEEPFKENIAVKRIEEPVKQSQEYINRSEVFMKMNDTEELILARDVEEMKLKVKELESKLTEAKATILHLTEEKRLTTQEKHCLQGELDLLKSKRHRAQVGFPLLFVFMVSLVNLYIGYLLHS